MGLEGVARQVKGCHTIRETRVHSALETWQALFARFYQGGVGRMHHRHQSPLIREVDAGFRPVQQGLPLVHL